MKTLIATFAGDSGDGIQLLGSAFADIIAQQNLELNTLPDFPAEIRAPAGTMSGVSGFQIQWSDSQVLTAGHKSDILIAFNAAGFKKFISQLKPDGLLIYDPAGFDPKNCKLSQVDISELDHIKQNKQEVRFSELTRSGLMDQSLTDKERDKNKNIFALGYMLFGLGGDIVSTRKLLKSKFKTKESILESMYVSLQQGYNFAEITEFSYLHFKTKIEKKKAGFYKNVTGNKGIAYALLAAPKIFGRKLFFGGYPITPASDILHELSRNSFEEVVVRQAEDEIAAAGMALGAAFGGCIGVTASSGPGIDLKQEAIGLAVMSELPLLIIDIQRAGPSTGLPTKVEQSDLELALYGRHGDSPVPVVSIRSAIDAYDRTIEAIDIMIRYQTPVILLSDALVANASGLWKIPKLEAIQYSDEPMIENNRSANLVKKWKQPGVEDDMFILGGLEQDSEKGGISYEAQNHQTMTEIRHQKIQNISMSISPIKLEPNSSNSGNLIVTWGSTYGVVREVLDSEECVFKDRVGHIHLDWIFPLPNGFVDTIFNFDQIIVPELNNGQLANYLQQFTKKRIHKINKIQGLPFYKEELLEEISQIVYA